MTRGSEEKYIPSLPIKANLTQKVPGSLMFVLVQPGLRVSQGREWGLAHGESQVPTGLREERTVCRPGEHCQGHLCVRQHPSESKSTSRSSSLNTIALGENGARILTEQRRCKF